MKYDARFLPIVDPLTLRQFTFTKEATGYDGGYVVSRDFEVEDRGVITERHPEDDDVIDCSNGIFRITNTIIVSGEVDYAYCVFPSRRAMIDKERSHNNPEWFDPDNYLFVGNPIRIIYGDGEMRVVSDSSYRIRL